MVKLMQKKSDQKMKIELGDDFFWIENQSIHHGKFASFVDDKKKKALIFTGSSYKTVLTKKRLQETRMSILAKMDAQEHLGRKFRKINRELIPDSTE